MTFSPLKPDAGPSPKVDVTQIQTDFAQWDTIFKVNHTAMNNLNQGNHEAIIFKTLSVDPVIDNTFDSLFSKLAGSEPQLFIRIPQFLPIANDPTEAPNDPMQLTISTVNTAGPEYQSFMAGGNIIYFGTTNNIALTITLSPAPSEILIAIASPTTFSASKPWTVCTQILSSSTFKILSNATGVYKFNWFAIGKA